MTVILRVLSLVSAFLMLVFLIMPLLVMKHGASPIKDVLASVFFLVVAVLALRCTIWLWRERRFWTQPNSLGEVAAFASLMLVWPFVSFLEQRTAGLGKDLVHVAAILVILSVYRLARRYGTTVAAVSDS